MTEEQATGHSPVQAEAVGTEGTEGTEAGASRALGLMAKLNRESMRETAQVQADLLESTRAQLRKIEVTLELVRQGICDLLDRPWLPHPDAIKAALWPMQEQVKMRLDEEMPPVINDMMREGRSVNGIF